MFRPLRRSQLVWDIVGASLLLLIGWPVIGVASATGMEATSGWTALGAVLSTVLAAGAAAIRRLSPPLALMIAWVAALMTMAFVLIPGVIIPVVFMVLFATSAYGSKRTMYWGLASVVVGSLLASAYVTLATLAGAFLNPSVPTEKPGTTLVLVITAAMFVACIASMGLSWAFGLLLRNRLRTRRVEREREIAEALAVAEQQRTQIARDMHDVVAHSLAVVIAQADGARYASVARPEAATEALRTIASTARGALSDVRLLLTQLRHSQAEGPQPTLADLEMLYTQVRQAGVDLRVDIDPIPRGDPPGAIQLAVYRILQEALTNAMRHGDDSGVDVYLSWYPDRVDLGVINVINLQDSSRPGGHGLIGMRERAQLVGGTLDAGADATDGRNRFVVRASIPITEIAEPAESAAGSTS
ncbi:sensor histidine kinase [Microbacterium sp. ZW T5_56]|uniref:sensor histidine kinase n=1 Tax=Microbacterium sp. ZW T5_56 TaxID=3378081 RepID=UPI0038555AAB